MGTEPATQLSQDPRGRTRMTDHDVFSRQGPFPLHHLWTLARVDEPYTSPHGVLRRRRSEAELFLNARIPVCRVSRQKYWTLF